MTSQQKQFVNNNLKTSDTINGRLEQRLSYALKDSVMLSPQNLKSLAFKHVNMHTLHLYKFEA